MKRYIILLSLFLTIQNTVTSAQVNIRLFSDRSPETAIFSVTEGRYDVTGFNGANLIVNKGEPLIITRYDGKLAVKTLNSKGFECDSVMLSGKTGDDSFSLRINGNSHVQQFYTGDIRCYPDMETLVIINTCDIEKYIEGVVKAEGGSGKNSEYFKTQAVIARTYLYKYYEKHAADKYNLCDNTHCQVYSGLSSDTIINNAIMDTKNLVILNHDSTLIISAFHSNCGGETASSEDVWLSSQPYLKSIVDPYCLSSRNSKWEKSLSTNSWIEYLTKSGYNSSADDQGSFSFSQRRRLTDYTIGSFKIPLRIVRNDMNLRSTFFSMVLEGDSIKFKGRGYGHGVGLCQEGAMVMASKGFTYKQIIDFYYFDVIISDVSNSKIKENN